MEDFSVAPACNASNNEVFSSCYGHCGPQCGDPEPKICTMICMPGCICRKGFAKDANGRCIPKNRCPKVTTTRSPPGKLYIGLRCLESHRSTDT